MIIKEVMVFTYRRVAERIKALVLKTSDGNIRGFESHPFCHKKEKK